MVWSWIAAGITLGVWALQQQAELPRLVGAWIIPCLVFSAIAVHKQAELLRVPVLVGCSFAVGFYWAATWASVRVADQLPLEAEGRDLRVTGVVMSMPDRTRWGWRFRFEVEHVLTPGTGVPRDVLLNWLEDSQQQLGVNDTRAPIMPGERWRFVVRLKRPHGNYNPNGFDYESVLLERDFGATGYVRPLESRARLTASVLSLTTLIERARLVLRERMRIAVEGHEYGGVLIALALGDQRAISQQQWQLFTRTGVNHLMSISGLHITLLAALMASIGQWCWRRSAALTQALPARIAAGYFGFATALVYALLTGFAIPAQRTVLMLGVATVAMGARSTVPAATVLAIALLCVLLFDPWAVNSPGFWLSFLAVAVLMLSSRMVRSLRGKLIQWGREQWALTLVLAPCLLVWFQQVSLVSPLANTIAVPLISFVVVPLALLLCAVPASFIGAIGDLALQIVVSYLEFLSQLPQAVWWQPVPSVLHVVVATLGAVILMLPRGLSLHTAGAMLLLPLMLTRPQGPNFGEAQVTVLDVGQGLATVVRTEAETLLFDAGPIWSEDADSGTRIVVPFLRSQGLNRLDAIVVSHNDSDHSGGVASVIAALPTAWLASSWIPDITVVSRDLPRIVCKAGQRWTWSGVEFEMLHPSPGSFDGFSKDNDLSCVLRVKTAHGSVLLTGDIEERSEQALLRRGADVRAEVLVAPHHGSQTSSSVPFITAVAPQHVVFAAGYRNRFGHPHKDVLKRYQAAGSVLWRTDKDGAITIWLRGEAPSVSGWRDERPRYWHTHW